MAQNLPLYVRLTLLLAMTSLYPQEYITVGLDSLQNTTKKVMAAFLLEQARLVSV